MKTKIERLKIGLKSLFLKSYQTAEYSEEQMEALFFLCAVVVGVALVSGWLR